MVFSTLFKASSGKTKAIAITGMYKGPGKRRPEFESQFCYWATALLRTLLGPSSLTSAIYRPLHSKICLNLCLLLFFLRILDP